MSVDRVKRALVLILSCFCNHGISLSLLLSRCCSLPFLALTLSVSPSYSNGIFGRPFEEVFSDFYSSGNGITVITAHLPQVSLDMKRDPSTQDFVFTLDKFAHRAVSALPPPPVDSTVTGIDVWWTKYHDIFYTFFENYGTSVVVTDVLLGGMVQLVSSYANKTVSPSTLQEDTFNDFHNLTGTYLRARFVNHDMNAVLPDLTLVSCPLLSLSFIILTSQALRRATPVRTTLS